MDSFSLELNGHSSFYIPEIKVRKPTPLVGVIVVWRYALVFAEYREKKICSNQIVKNKIFSETENKRK